MAIYHYSAKVISRSHGHSVTAAAAYRSGERIVDERTGETHDYSRRKGVLASEIHAPDGSPAWVHDRTQLWNNGEHAETRKDAQLAREVVMALPFELTHEQRMELVGPYAQAQYVAKGMIADISYHAPDKHGDNRNHHCHILLTLRPLNDHGEFGNKERAWNDKHALIQDRQAWAEHMNRALERAGIKERVDERSFADQGLDRVPTKHLGKDASAMERDGKDTRIGHENREAEYWNRELAKIEQDEKIINLAIEREKRKIADEPTRKAALAQKLRGETLRKQTQGFHDDAPLLARQHNALHLKHLDERRALEGQIDQRRAEMDATTTRFYDKQATHDALAKAQDDLRKADTLTGRLSGRERDAKERVEALRLNLEDIERRQAERSGFFDRNAREQLAALEQRHQTERQPPPSPPSPDHERDSEDFRAYTPDTPSPRAVNDNDRSQDRDTEPDHGPSMDR